MFSSWSPTAALVDGVKRGSARRSASTRPAGTASPWIVPDVRYSFHDDPATYARTMHSIGSISARRHNMMRPSSSGRRADSGRSATSVETRWLPMTPDSASNQWADMAVRTRPLSGTGSAITTSNADSRSDATINN